MMPPHTGDPKTLDFTVQRGSGHDLTYRPDPDNQFALHGFLWHAPAPVAGDWLVLQNPEHGRPVLYRFTATDWLGNVEDMYRWSAEFVVLSERPDVIPQCCCRFFDRRGVFSRG